MDFMLLFIDRKDARAGTPAGMAELNQYAEELMRAGALRRAAPLDSEPAAARVRVRDGKAFVIDGPFAESQEVVGGFWIVSVPKREEAIEIAVRAFELGEPRPHARGGVIEVHQLAREHQVAADPGGGAAYLLAFQPAPGVADPDGSKLREMIAFGETLTRERKFLEAAPLATNPAPLRIQSRRGKTVATDGPFAESKDVIGGYALVRAASRAEAIELAQRYPFAKWGRIELRALR